MDDSTLSDKILVIRCQRELPDSTRSFEYLVRRYTQRVYALVYRIVANREEAEDITQEVFIKACYALPRLQQPALFSAWLYRTATNAALDALEKRKRRPLGESLDQEQEEGQQAALAVASGPGPEEQLARRELRDCINTVLGGLERDQARVLVMRDLEDLSYDDMARALDLSLGAIKMRLHRARLAFQRLFIKLCGQHLQGRARSTAIRGRGRRRAEEKRA